MAPQQEPGYPMGGSDNVLERVRLDLTLTPKYPLVYPHMSAGLPPPGPYLGPLWD